MRSVCRDESMPALSTVLLWVTDDREGFSVHYARAREAQAHTHVDEMMDLRHGLLNGEIDPQAAKVVTDMIKWSASRMNRKFFADKAPDDAGVSNQPITRIEVVTVGQNAPDKRD